MSPVHGITSHVSWPRFQSIRSWQWSRLFSRGSFLTSERCSNISLNLVCPRACWRYCLALLRHELLRKVDCVSSSRDHRPCFVVSKAYDLGNFGLQHVGEVCVLSSRGSFLTSERCSNISLNLVCPRACWRYCLVSLRHELLRKVDCVPQSWKLFGIPFLSPSTT